MSNLSREYEIYFESNGSSDENNLVVILVNVEDPYLKSSAHIQEGDLCFERISSFIDLIINFGVCIDNEIIGCYIEFAESII